MEVELIVLRYKFEQLYAAVEDMTRKSATMTPLFRELESTLKCYRPLISAMAKRNINLDRDHHDLCLEELLIKLQEGHQLINMIRYHSMKGVWNSHKKKKNKKKLRQFSNSLDACLVRLNHLQQALSMAELMDRVRIQHDEAVHEVMQKPAADVTTSETESDVIQVQPFPRRIQNWLVNGSYGSWRIVFLVPFLLSIIMAATGSTAGTKWFVFNFGINNLGINNN